MVVSITSIYFKQDFLNAVHNKQEALRLKKKKKSDDLFLMYNWFYTSLN